MNRPRRRLVIPAVGAGLVAAVLLQSGSAGGGNLVRYETRLGISDSAPAFHGRVRSENDACIVDRKVRLFRKQKGPDELLGTDRSSDLGRWKIEVDPLSGAYYVRVQRRGEGAAGTTYVCKRDRSRTVVIDMRLMSPSFADGGEIPRRYTCLGDQVSPPLAWRGVPEGTRELELLVTDASLDDFSHWVVYAIPAGETASPEAGTPAGAKQGRNGLGLDGYVPPCPFIGLDAHRYVFELFASEQALELPKRPTDEDVRAALQGNVLAAATLTGTYKLGD